MITYKCTSREEALVKSRKIFRRLTNRTGIYPIDIYYRLLTKYHLWPA